MRDGGAAPGKALQGDQALRPVSVLPSAATHGDHPTPPGALRVTIRVTRGTSSAHVVRCEGTHPDFAGEPCGHGLVNLLGPSHLEVRCRRCKGLVEIKATVAET